MNGPQTPAPMEDVETSDILPGKTKKQRIDMNKQQRLMKSIVDKSITNMARSFQALVETTVIGNSSMQGNLAQDEEQGDGVGVENQEFSDLYTGLMKHKFQSAVHARSMVESSRELMSLIDALKHSILLLDTESSNSDMSRVSHECLWTCAANERALATVAGEVRETLDELEQFYSDLAFY